MIINNAQTSQTQHYCVFIYAIAFNYNKLTLLLTALRENDQKNCIQCLY